jgi:predicted anti-sigma-YlaC factor YlaD
MKTKPPVLMIVVFAALLNTACSVRKFAVAKIGDAIASSGTTFSSDDDPQLVRDAVPFSLKLIESLLAETPKHRGLLLAASRGFTQYAFAFIQQDADEMESRDFTASQDLRRRARLLYLRARDYGLRGLEVKYPKFGAGLRADPLTAAARIRRASDVPLLYWTAAAWGAAISLSKDDPDLIADQTIVEALMDRALVLDEKFEAGSIHGFFITYEQSRQGVTGDPEVRSKTHFDRALELSEGKLASPLVSYAEAVSVVKHDRGQFDTLLKRALAVNPNDRPEWKLENLVMQRRARWLLERTSELFADELPQERTQP